MLESEILSHPFTWSLDECSWTTPKNVNSFRYTDTSRSIDYFVVNEHESLKTKLFT